MGNLFCRKKKAGKLKKAMKADVPESRPDLDACFTASLKRVEGTSLAPRLVVFDEKTARNGLRLRGSPVVLPKTGKRKLVPSTLSRESLDDVKSESSSLKTISL